METLGSVNHGHFLGKWHLSFSHLHWAKATRFGKSLEDFESETLKRVSSVTQSSTNLRTAPKLFCQSQHLRLHRPFTWGAVAPRRRGVCFIERKTVLLRKHRNFNMRPGAFISKAPHIFRPDILISVIRIISYVASAGNRGKGRGKYEGKYLHLRGAPPETSRNIIRADGIEFRCGISPRRVPFFGGRCGVVEISCTWNRDKRFERPKHVDLIVSLWRPFLGFPHTSTLRTPCRSRARELPKHCPRSANLTLQRENFTVDVSSTDLHSSPQSASSSSSYVVKLFNTSAVWERYREILRNRTRSTGDDTGFGYFSIKVMVSIMLTLQAAWWNSVQSHPVYLRGDENTNFVTTHRHHADPMQRAIHRETFDESVNTSHPSMSHLTVLKETLIVITNHVPRLDSRLSLWSNS